MANDTTPLMLITNAGLAAASRALPQGPYIHIVKFQIGSAYGYTPDVNQTALQGNILYGGDDAHPAVPSDYRSIGDNTLDIILEIPPEAGPWEFGEVGIFAEDQNHVPYLFAIAVFQSPQTKFSSLGTNVVSSYTLNCLLKLQQSVAIFQIDTSIAHPYVLDVFQWSDVYPPSLSADPDIPLYNIKETNSRGAGTALITTSDGSRTLEYGAYEEIWAAPQFGAFIVQASSASYIEVTQAQFNTYRISTLGGVQYNRAWLVQTTAGFWRSVSSIVASGNNYRLNLNVTNDGTYNNYPLPVVPQIGEKVHIYTDYLEGRNILYEQIIDPPPIPLATPGTPGLATAGHGLNMDAPGIMAAYGLLHQPSQGTGQFLTGGDLNQINLDSGLYTISWNQGHPANGPYDQGFPQTTGIDFHLMQICPERGQGTNGGSITQLYMPLGQGNGGQPIYWRQCHSGTWFPWFALNIKQGSTGTQTYYAQTNINNQAVWTGTSSPIGGLPALTKPGIFHSWLVDDQANNTNLYVNGWLVSQNSKNGGSGYGRRHHDFAMFMPGDQITFSVSGNPVVGIEMMLFG